MEKPPYCMIPAIWHSGKNKTMERVKDYCFPMVKKGEGINRWNTGLLGQWNYYVWHYNSRYMPLYTCQN